MASMSGCRRILAPMRRQQNDYLEQHGEPILIGLYDSSRRFFVEQCLQRLWDDDTEFAAYQDARQPPPPPLQEISINKPPRIKTIATTDWEERELARGNTFTSTFDLQSWVALGKSSQSFNSQDSAYASQPEQQPQHQEISIQTSYLQSQQPQFTIYEDAGAGSDVDAAGSTDDEATCGNIPTSPQPYVSPPPHI
ncbi:hypothetical protein BU23DRAFT_566165 [Bimuria novae-zelandiae CBS 107.79]|uniref:Uncharacterized protein n=1 Tax=Bimuria novae-zelandiae CBS 107.79 TaxID=1447943 RepID=A0A6A5VJM8_9PLEO|nr:hypothetical protein BU23DRAFT_566165 [Bimuria novae-zelandiae CBS 107.79]